MAPTRALISADAHNPSERSWEDTCNAKPFASFDCFRTRPGGGILRVRQSSQPQRWVAL